MNKKIMSILTLCTLFLMSAGFAISVDNTESETQQATFFHELFTINEDIQTEEGCLYFCSYCLPINGDGACDTGGSCC